jgi:molybdate/tungstate transport system substrate-binding protein
MESSVQARMQSGELDAASAYKIQPGPFNLPYIALPKELNLSGQNVHAEHPDVSLSIAGKTYFPEPLVFYAAALKEAGNPRGAAAFTDWLQGGEAQAILRRYLYDAPGDAPVLRG